MIFELISWVCICFNYVNKSTLFDLFQSLSQAFIRFLEDESSPRPSARLPAVEMAEQAQEKADKKAKFKAQNANKVNNYNCFINLMLLRFWFIYRDSDFFNL